MNGHIVIEFGGELPALTADEFATVHGVAASCCRYRARRLLLRPSP